MFISQSLSGVPTASILRLMLCSIGDNITQLSLFVNSHTAPLCCTKNAQFYSDKNCLIYRSRVFLSTLHSFAILRFETFAFSSSCISVSFPCNLYFSIIVFDSPHTTFSCHADIQYFHNHE